MPKLSKFFRVAVEGAAADGRTINRQDLEDIALTYDPTVFGARVDLEHYKSLMPDSVFRCYGDVTAVKTEKITNGPLSGKLALLAQINPTDEMLTLNKSRQKVYTSIQFSPNFADSGRAYLKGLALTDNPGSLGTEMIQFCAQQVAAGKRQITGWDNDRNAIRTFNRVDIDRFLSVEAEATTKRTSKKQPMFRRLRNATFLRLQALPDSAGVGYTGVAAKIAQVHQYGGTDQVNPYVKADYPARQLLGITSKDGNNIIDQIFNSFLSLN
ncbi:TPA: phage virion morphogenesis protein [Yersinia enterocolitica]